MSEELNIEELLAELEGYRWRDKKAVILKELDLRYEANRSFTLIEILNISKGADDLINISKEGNDLLSKGYTADEILKAIREWVKERLDEIEKEKEQKQMRDIKFRAWRKGISYIFSKPYLLAEYTVLSFLPEDEELKGIDCFGYDDFEFDCIEQFTGLKDKNGVEIYEGDIIIYDFTTYVTKEPVMGVVKYSTESAAYGIVPLAYPDSIEWFGELAINAPLEVIGNIHDKENKNE